jgi:ABC-type nitrate/sulfonate/bicarbonate transport system substrate-binding protein
VKSIKDFQGRKIANSPKPSGPWLALKFDLDQMGINAELVEMRSGGDRISALLTGQVDAALLSPQFQALYGKKLRLVHTSSISKYLWNSCGWWMKRDYLNAHPEAARRFVQGLAKARHLINSNPDEAVDIFSKYGHIRNTKFVEPFKLASFDEPPAVYQYGLQKVIDIMHQYGMLDKPIKAQDYVDGRFARLIDQDY